MTPRAFSFNSPHGACPDCQGLGAVYDFDPARLVPDESLSLQDGAIAPWAKGDRKLVKEALAGLSRTFGIDLTLPFRRLPKKMRDVLFFGAAGSARKTESEPAARGKKRKAAPRSVRRRLRRADPEPAPPLRRGHAGSSRRTSSRIARCGPARRARGTG